MSKRSLSQTPLLDKNLGGGGVGTLALLRERFWLFFVMGGGVVVDLFFFAVGIVITGNIMIAQWTGMILGMGHDFVFLRGGAHSPKIFRTLRDSGGWWLIFFFLASVPMIFVLGYLTNSIWVAKLIVSVVVHFWFCSALSPAKKTLP